MRSVLKRRPGGPLAVVVDGWSAVLLQEKWKLIRRLVRRRPQDAATAFDCLMAQLRHKRPKARFLPHLLAGAVIVDSRPAYSLVIDAVFVVAV